MSPWEYFIKKAESLDEILKAFEGFLSSDDYIEEADGKKYLVETRVRVGTINGYKIEIYSDEHSPPHFHIVKNNKKLAAYTIDDCKKLSGDLPNKLERKVLFFHECAKDKLIEFWNNTRHGNCEVGEID
jgi:hypothetical protein